jgi:UDP-N-acetylglucosamine--N-acetylmuramyl-(pentapeptide) pyrophosphoryl-undecaprenol N-acetylglucosamine transferase
MKFMHRKYIISGGGTGGHIFPALSIANEIKKKDTAAEILFVGATGRMEMERVPAAGYPIIGLPVEGIKRKKVLRNILVWAKLLISLFKALQIINKFKPDVVIGVGGYASGPVLRMAAMKRIPYIIQEQNSYAGITNRLLAKKASAICVAYAGMEKYFPADKIVVTGNPVRETLLNNGTGKESACAYFGITHTKPVLLILGGSLGARTINTSIINHMALIESADIQVLWQTGSLYIENTRTILSSQTLKNVKYFDFITRMDMAYSAADVIISRAGAATISELCLLGKPAILVPSPNVAEDHQTKNAMALVQNNAALMITDKDAPEMLIKQAIELINNQELRSILSTNSSKMALSGASSKIVDEILNLLQGERVG